MSRYLPSHRPRLSALLIFVTLLIVSAQVSAQSLGQRLVLAIGVNDFADDFWRPLRFPQADAKGIYRFFTEETDRRADFARLLINTPERRVEVKDVLSALDILREKNRSEDDVVIVFLATHGTVFWTDGEDGTSVLARYLVFGDTNHLKVKESALLFERFLAAFRMLRSTKKVLIIDSCYSGTGRSQLTPGIAENLKKMRAGHFPLLEHPDHRAEIVLASTRANEGAWEFQELNHGVYTYFLLEGFSKDQNGDGAVSVTEAHAYAAARTHDFTQGKQNPTAIANIYGSDPIVVSGHPEQSQNTLVMSLGHAFRRGWDLWTNGSRRGALENGLALPPGRNHLSLVDPATGHIAFEGTVYLRPGREYAIESLIQSQKNHTSHIGATLDWFAQRSAREAVGSEPLVGISLEYRHAGFIRSFDGVARISYSPPQERRGTLGSLSRSDVNTALGTSDYPLRLSGLAADLWLTQRDCVAPLTWHQRSLHGGITCSGGPSATILMLESVFLSQQTQQATAIGARMVVGYEVDHAPTGAQGGVALSTAVYSRIFAGVGSGVTVVASATLFAGFSW